jgi:hypothetical protein
MFGKVVGESRRFRSFAAQTRRNARLAYDTASGSANLAEASFL